MAQRLSVLTMLPKASTFGAQHLYLIAYNSGALCQPLDNSIYMDAFCPSAGGVETEGFLGLADA